MRVLIALNRLAIGTSVALAIANSAAAGAADCTDYFRAKGWQYKETQDERSYFASYMNGAWEKCSTYSTQSFSYTHYSCGRITFTDSPPTIIDKSGKYWNAYAGGIDIREQTCKQTSSDIFLNEFSQIIDFGYQNIHWKLKRVILTTYKTYAPNF